MAAGAIAAEMTPKGVLRPKIRQVLEDRGAYLIASSKEDLADPEYDARIEAMTTALGPTGLPPDAVIDFYDQSRLARYANEYPSVAIWVRDALGEPTFHWEGHGNWSRSLASGPYAIDPLARVRCSSEQTGALMPVAQAVESLREALIAGNVARLTGQSGTGKTRLAEVLFERPPVDGGDVLYTNCGAGPTPAPADMIRRLVTSQRRCVVVLDNCPLPLHTTCAPLVENSPVSLLTIEADVDDEVGRKTTAFHLRASSSAVIDEILLVAAPKLSQKSRARIADFAGGNARIALALADGLNERRNISGLRDVALVNSLFRTGTQDDPALSHAAEICSLVYSFNGAIDSPELKCLAKLAETSAKTLYRQVATLHARELVQQRGDWRAVLPQALAHRLAARALRGLDLARLRRRIEKLEDGRLLGSFARRLGCLPDSAFAVKMAGDWVDELMDDPTMLPSRKATLIGRLAPLVPDRVLDQLERLSEAPGVDGQHADHSCWAKLLRHLAYDEATFDRAVETLVRLALDERLTHRDDSLLRIALHELFRLGLSGTLAPPQQRAQVVRQLLSSEDAGRQALGIELARAMLDTGPYTSSFDSGFGAEPRSFGWWATWGASRTWFTNAVGLLGAPCSVPTLRALAHELAVAFRGLVHAGFLDLVRAALPTILTVGPWFDGWISARETLKYERTLPATQRRQLEAIDCKLAPRSLDQKLEAYFNARHSSMLFDNDAARNLAMRDMARGLLKTPARWSRRLATCFGDRALGQALAQEATDTAAIWTFLLAALRAQPAPRDARLLAGFLEEMQVAHPAFVSVRLDAALDDPDLLPLFPMLQVLGDLDAAAVRRLITVARNPHFEIQGFRLTGNAAASPRVPAALAADLVKTIAQRVDGLPIALEFLQLRLLNRPKGVAIEPSLLDVGRHLLSTVPAAALVAEESSFQLTTIAEHVLKGRQGTAVARLLLETLAVQARTGLIRHAGPLLQSICGSHPQTGLSVLLGKTTLADDDSDHLTWNLRQMQPFAQVPVGPMVAWVKKDPRRAPQVARLMTMLVVNEGEVSFSPLAENLLTVVENQPEEFLKVLTDHFHLEDGWVCDRIADLDAFLAFATRLANHRVRPVALWAQDVRANRVLEAAGRVLVAALRIRLDGLATADLWMLERASQNAQHYRG